MSITKRTINGNEYKFVNESYDTRDGFGHRTELYKNEHPIAKKTVRYLNRTWECYQYQSVMFGAVRKMMKETENQEIDKYKRENNKSRMTKKAKEIVESKLKDNAEYKEYQELYDALR